MPSITLTSNHVSRSAMPNKQFFIFGLGKLVLTLKALGIFLTRLALLAEYFFPILYKIGTFLRSALHVKVNFGSKTYDSRS